MDTIHSVVNPLIFIFLKIHKCTPRHRKNIWLHFWQEKRGYSVDGSPRPHSLAFYQSESTNTVCQELNSYTGIFTRNLRDIYNYITYSDKMTTHEKIQDMHSRSNSLTLRALFTRNLNMCTLFTRTNWQHIDKLIIQEINKFHRVNSLCHK